CLRAVAYTVQPAAASRSAVALQMPDEQPVMRTTREMVMRASLLVHLNHTYHFSSSEIIWQGCYGCAMAVTARGNAAKRDAIVRAATTLFSRYGFRKTTVDLIAHEAEVAKPTLYAHFSDKEAIFVAVCQHVVDRILAAATAELERPDVIDRFTGILAAKFTTVFEL